MAEPEMTGLWHAALFYQDAADFEAQACLFAEDAARAGAAMLVVGPLDSLVALRARLNGFGDQLTWVDAADMERNPGRLISAINRFTIEHAGQPTWCVQQAAWPSRPAEELWEVLRHEALLNQALAGAPLRVLCPYDTRLPQELLACAEAAHPLISAGRGFQPSPGYRDDLSEVVPAECDRPLPAPPADAWKHPYSDDLAAVRDLVRLRAQAAGLPRDRASDLLIAVGELAANTLVHAGGRGMITMWTTGAEAVCQFSDAGYIPDPLAGRLRPGPGADRGGRGLWLVHQLCDLVQVRTSPRGTTVRVHMRLPGGVVQQHSWNR